MPSMCVFLVALLPALAALTMAAAERHGSPPTTSDGDGDGTTASLTFQFPRRDVATANTYQYVRFPVPHPGFTITTIQSQPTHPTKTHHMKFLICAGGGADDGEVLTGHGEHPEPPCWDAITLGGFESLDYVRSGATDPERTEFPEGCGRTVGGDCQFTHVMIEAHYNSPVVADEAGFVVEGVVGMPSASSVKQVSLFSMGKGMFELPPGQAAVAVDTPPMQALAAFRLLEVAFHFHYHGAQIDLEVSHDAPAYHLNATYRAVEGKSHTVRFYRGEAKGDDGAGDGDGDRYLIPAGAVFRATCTYDTTAADRTIHSGPADTDEMCTLFVLGAREDPCDPRTDACRFPVSGAVGLVEEGHRSVA